MSVRVARRLCTPDSRAPLEHQVRHAKTTGDAFEEAAGSDKFRDGIETAKARTKGDIAPFHVRFASLTPHPPPISPSDDRRPFADSSCTRQHRFYLHMFAY